MVKDVDETTERPATTEDEVVTLIKRARRYRIKPHILQLSCDDYRQLVDNEGVDYQRLLELTGERLRDKLLGIAKVRLDPIKRAVDDSLREAWGSGGGRNRDLVVVYGGAIHNDLHPAEETASFSYGPAIAQTAGPRYIEIDLVVPEYLTKDQALVRKQPWFPLFERHQSKRKALLIRQSKSSYVLVFRRSS